MANLTTNVDIDFIQKDFSSTVDALIAFSNVNFGPGTSANRLWSNFNADSFSRNWLEIVSHVADVFFFYFDAQATQSYLQTATVRSAIEDIAKQFGFTPATATSASGTATFTVTGAGTILRGFKVRATNGAEFFTTADIISSGAGEVSGPVLQGVIVSESFTAEGLQNEEMDLQNQEIVRDLDNLNPQDISPQITVSGNSYTLVDSLIRHDGSDTAAVEDSLGNVIGGGGRVYTLEERPDGTKFLKFGDGIFGRKLNAGENIAVTYRSGGGSIGNIPEASLTNLVDTNVIVTAVTNNAEFSGGADEQSIEQLRELIPASLRTLDRAVAEQDYSDIHTANFSEVFAASTEANNTDAGVDLNVYVVPQGAGITNITTNTVLRDRLINFLDRRKMVTVQFQILDAFGVDSLITLEVFITDTASRSTVTSAIQTALLDFFSLETGGSGGAGVGFAEPILIKDICDILDNVSGIERFEIKRLSYRPRIDENVVGLVTTYISSDVTIFPNVSESEWLLAASGPQNETSGTVVFNNDSGISFTYTSGTGEIAYSFPVELDGVAPGDLFRDGLDILEFTILAVDVPNSKVYIATGQTVDTTGAAGAGGSIRNGSTSFEAFKCFKKIKAAATNLSIDSITDNNLDLSVASGTGASLSARVLLDNVNVYVPGEFATGDFYLVDAAGNIWEIEENDGNTIKTAISAVNDAAITTVTAGDYKVVTKLTNQQVLFQGNIFNIQFNSENTVFSTGAQFSQIGTISDDFEISELQSNVGNLGSALDLIVYDSGTGQIRLNSAPDLGGVSSDFTLIDSDGQLFNVVGVDNRAQPSVFYDSVNQDKTVLLEGSGLGIQIAQGFKVATTDIYAVVSFELKKEGNIVGDLTARIVADDGGGSPDLSSPIAVSETVSVDDISSATLTKAVFSFATPPTLTAATQYHVVLSSDSAYIAAEQNGIKSFDNTGPTAYTYNATSGVIQYGAAVNLGSVLPGHFFEDNSGDLFTILSVSDVDDTITIASGQTVDDAGGGHAVIYDRVIAGIDTSSPSYVDGEFAAFNGVSWSNSTSGPDDFTTTPYPDQEGGTFTEGDLIFTAEGTKTITVDSNLIPSLGPGATVSKRYYDDDNEVSFILGISSGSITFAADVNALGIGTVASVPNRPVDTFIFRTSRFADDIVNLRANEIPELQLSDIQINIFGGVQ